MKKQFGYAMLFTLMISIQSCFVYQNTPASAPMLSRYKKMKDPANLDEDKAPINISAFSTITPDVGDTSKPKTILNLQGQGQRELISQYGKLYGNKADDFNSALNAVFFKKDDDGGYADFSNKSVSITISVTRKTTGTLTKNDLALGDRLEYIKMEFKLDTGLQGIYFKSWDKVKTQYGRFFIGSQSFTGNQEVNINPSVTLASSAAFSLGNYDSKSQYTEQDTLTQQTVVSNGVLNEHYFSLDQTGTAKTTLMGNSIINLNIGTKTPVPGIFFSFDKLYESDKVLPLEKVKIKLRNYWISDNSKDITGTLTCTYRFRHILDGDRTYTESDDSVIYQYGKITTKPVKLIEKKDLTPRYWYVTNKITKQDIMVKDLLNTSVKPTNLNFASNDEAVDFLGWLIQVSDPSSKFIQKAESKKPGITHPKGKPVKPVPVPLIFNGRYELVTSGEYNKYIPLKTGDSTSSYRVDIFQLK